MIQELFGGGAAGLLNRDRTLPVSASFEPSPSPSPSSSTTNTTTATPTSAPTAANPTTSDIQKLRCPRCDSANTKFCYYNNYNLTQPRHFCKTCRRYWTKGGALRNVPIGGGCRKNKGSTIATTIGKPISATGKLKAVVSSELGNSGFINGFEHEFAHNPILWSGPPQTSHLLSLLRATQNPNPNFASNSATHMKDQGFMVGSHNMSHLGFEPLGQASSLGLCSSLWRNNQQSQQNQQEQHQQGIMNSGHHHEVQNTENMNQGQRYQRLRSSSPVNYFHHDQTSPLILGGNVVNTSSSSISTSTILDSAPVLASGEMGFWNQSLPWSDLAAANGAYP